MCVYMCFQVRVDCIFSVFMRYFLGFLRVTSCFFVYLRVTTIALHSLRLCGEINIEY